MSPVPVMCNLTHVTSLRPPLTNANSDSHRPQQSQTAVAVVKVPGGRAPWEVEWHNFPRQIDGHSAI